MKYNALKITSLFFVLTTIVSCEKYKELETPDWTETTHSLRTPDYAIFFQGDKLHTIEIEVNAGFWGELLESTSRLYGNFGTVKMQQGPPPPPPANGNTLTELIALSAPAPDFVPCNLKYGGKNWYNVGFRFKGNSSLNDSWQQGIWKLPLKLDFSKFGDYYEKIADQRFYGFDKFAYASNFKDPSQVREKLAYELMGEFGIPVPKVSFAKIYINNGAGQEYYGVYTMAEIVEDATITRLYGEIKGNCYKPSGNSATLQKGKLNAYELAETTTKSNDYSDVENFVNILHDNTRISNPELWRSNLEKIFEVDLFLKFLAANTVMQNWDSYGKTSQNYYLYHSPTNDRLVFIPWDLSETFEKQSMLENQKLDQSNVSDNWPLIKLLMADEVYALHYKDHVADFNENIFVPQKVISRIDQLYGLIKSSIFEEQPNYTHNNNEQNIQNYINQLKNQIVQRHSEVKSFYQK